MTACTFPQIRAEREGESISPGFPIRILKKLSGLPRDFAARSFYRTRDFQQDTQPVRKLVYSTQTDPTDRGSILVNFASEKRAPFI